MAKNEKRVQVTLACEVCKRRNYITMKSKVNDRERIEMNKYCQLRPAPHRAQGDPLGTLARRGGRLDVPYGPAGAAEGSGSIGRAPVSKTGGWGFESLLPCSKGTSK